MRLPRFGLPVTLFATVTLGAYITYPGNAAPAAALSQASLLASKFDPQLNSMLTTMVASAEIDPDGKPFFNDPLGDQRFLEPYSGRYWQISGEGTEVFASRSLWERRLKVSGRKAWTEPLYYNSDQFPEEPLRVVERTVRLPGSDVEWQFAVAGSRD